MTTRVAGIVLAATIAGLLPSTSPAFEQVIFEPDVDGNGVRDDMEEYISHTYSDDPVLQKFFVDYIRVFQEFVESYHNAEKSKEVSHRKIVLYLCLGRERPEAIGFIDSEIRPKLLNTYDLSLAYIKASSNLSGTILASPSDEELNKTCSIYF